MPKIPQKQLDATVTLLDELSLPVGTAFVVAFADIETMKRGYYLVTCDHCTKNRIRARFSDQRSLIVDPIDWSRPPAGEDVAVLDITDFVEASPGRIGSIDFGLAALSTEQHFTTGVDLFMPGLLLDEKDTGVNNPRVRFGNLSSFAKPADLIEQGNGHKGPCHLADMRSRTGFSGSPVIGYIEFTALSSRAAPIFRLMGIHSAQHKESITIFNHSTYFSAEINSSMTRVVPAWILIDLIRNDPKLITQRGLRPDRLL